MGHRQRDRAGTRYGSEVRTIEGNFQGNFKLMARGKRQHFDRITPPPVSFQSQPAAMAPKMKAMKAMKAVKSISKGGIADAISSDTELKKSEVSKVLGALADLAAKEVKKGKFTIPGICMIKTRKKPATKAGKREMFGKVVVVKAKPAKTVVKAFAVAALKQAV